MIIEKILNNNVVITKDTSGEELIVMGRGLAFKRKVGDVIDDTIIDKEFRISNKGAKSKFEQILVDIPIENIELAEEIISYAKSHLGKRLNDIIYVSLVDHIHTAIERFLDGITIKNALLWDIKRFYPDEFFIGTKALEIIKNTKKIELPEDEAGFIALHFVNAEIDEENMQNMYEITKIIQEIVNIIKYTFSIDFDEDGVHYYRLVTHLKFFAQRVVNGKVYDDSSSDDLYEVVKAKYVNSYKCVKKIEELINKKYNHQLTNEEKLYLIIHIERVVYKTNN